MAMAMAMAMVTVTVTVMVTASGLLERHGWRAFAASHQPARPLEMQQQPLHRHRHQYRGLLLRFSASSA